MRTKFKTNIPKYAGKFATNFAGSMISTLALFGTVWLFDACLIKYDDYKRKSGK
jgi:hypothetical protein